MRSGGVTEVREWWEVGGNGSGGWWVEEWAAVGVSGNDRRRRASTVSLPACLPAFLPAALPSSQRDSSLALSCSVR